MNPFFSIVIPCCNVAPYVRACLESVLRQPFTDWEALVGVEASKDETEDIVRAYAARDARIKVFTGPRSGSASVPRNRGIDGATGDYVIFVDGDDAITDGSLQRLHDKIVARPGADIYSCAMCVRDERTGRDGLVWEDYMLEAPTELSGPEATVLAGSYDGNYYPHLQLTIFRLGFLMEANLRCIPGIQMEDADFSPRALYQARRVVLLHEPFYIYRDQRPGSNMTRARQAAEPLDDWAVVFRSLFAFHAAVSREPGFDPRVTDRWSRQWLKLMVNAFFTPHAVAANARPRRLAALKALFADGFGDFRLLLCGVPFHRRLLGLWIRLFVLFPPARALVEACFRLDINLKGKRDTFRANCRSRHTSASQKNI